VRIPTLAHQIEDLHAFAADLARKVRHQRMQRGNLKRSRSGAHHSEQPGNT
jgi:hypothetical protein